MSPGELFHQWLMSAKEPDGSFLHNKYKALLFDVDDGYYISGLDLLRAYRAGTQEATNEVLPSIRDDIIELANRGDHGTSTPRHEGETAEGESPA